jgi:WD40 repeat protein
MSKRLGRSSFALLAGLAAACGSPVETTTPPPVLTGAGPFLTSNAVSVAASGSSSGGSVASGSRTYISLPPGTLPGASSVSIRVERTGTVVSALMAEGGLDPVAVPAAAGDILSLTLGPSSIMASVWRFEVSAIRMPPVIVRTRPEKNKRDVPLNASIVVVFSEPIDPASLTPQNFELRSAGSTVAGQLTFMNGGFTTVEFTPAANLVGASDYELVLRTGIRDTDGTPLESPASITFTTADPAPTGVTQLAFVRDNQIYVGNADGTGLVQLTNTVDGVWNDDPAWSPDGQRLAFSRYLRGDNGPEIYVMNADGSNVVRRTQGCECAKEPSGAGEPSWSPDGRTIAFTRDYDGNESGIYVVDAVGNSAARVLLDSPGFDFHPVWSPDGRQIAFGSQWQLDEPSPWWTWTLPSYDLWIMNADGSGIHPLLEWPTAAHPMVHHFNHSWSPDGRKLALGVFYMDLDANPQVWADIAVMNADGSGLRTIAHSGSNAAPAWSPDGRMIAFGSDCVAAGCRPSIRFVLVDGSAEGIIMTNANKPAWRPR